VDGTSSLERFTSSQVATHLKVFLTWGCLIYALNNALQAGPSIPKWNSRARLGINLGLSPKHARSVSLVLNLTTGNASPQFHVIHDNFFETVKDEDKSRSSRWLAGAGLINEEGESNPFPRIKDSFRSSENNEEAELNVNENEANELNSNEESQADQSHLAEDNQAPRRSQRNRRMTQRMRESLVQQGENNLSYAAEIGELEILHKDDYRIQEAMKDPISFAGLIEKDTMYYHEAMGAPDREEFIKAIVKEINDHIDGKHWVIINESDVPNDTIILDSVWSMKRKRNILTRQVYKWKTRLNAHGGQQEYGTQLECYLPWSC